MVKYMNKKEAVIERLWNLRKEIEVKGQCLLRIIDDSIHDLKEEPKKEEKTYKIGQRFKLECGEIEYILARIGGKEVILTSLSTGNLWTDGVMVGNVDAITEEEFEKITTSSNFIKL